MNYKKIILVGFISAFVAVLTSILGVTGTVIGSVISSVLYNMLSEALEDPVSTASFNADFEWEIAYIFPLAVIALIQLLLIFAMLSESGILPSTFLNAYLSLQSLANNNLYRILGFAMLIISVYPLVLKPDIIKKAHGVIIAFVGLIFLARGFVDMGNAITALYDDLFVAFDLGNKLLDGHWLGGEKSQNLPFVVYGVTLLSLFAGKAVVANSARLRHLIAEVLLDDATATLQLLVGVVE
jgi:hypothetical protein